MSSAMQGFFGGVPPLARRGQVWLARVSLAVACLAVAPATLALTDAEKAGARAAAEQGGLAYQDGRFAEAIDYFSRAEEIVHATPHLIFIARSHAKLGHLIAAREAYLKILQEEVSAKGPRIFAETKAQAEAELADLEPRIPYVSVVVEGAESKEFEVIRDGQVLPSVLVGIPQPVDPGEHTFRAKGKQRESAEVKVMVREGAQETVRLKLDGTAVASSDPEAHRDGVTPEDSGKPKKGLVVAGYAALGLGVVGGVLGTVFLVQSNNSYHAGDAIFEGCPTTQAGADCSQTERDQIAEYDSQGQTQTIVGATALAVGGAAVVTGVVLLVVGKGKKTKLEAPSGAYVQPVIGLASWGLRGAF